MKPADLQQFCADETDIRHYLCQPWSRGEWTYATNGHIIVRALRLADVDENPQAPNAEKMFLDSRQTEFVPVPDCTMPPDVDCENCDGTGALRNPAEDCEYCEHTGKIKSFDGMKVGNVHFAKRYLALIQGWEIAPNGQDKPAWIRNGVDDGLLMPRRKE